jgi:hypothetical protein
MVRRAAARFLVSDVPDLAQEVLVREQFGGTIGGEARPLRRDSNANAGVKIMEISGAP